MHFALGKFFVCAIFINYFFVLCNGFKILGVFPTACRSHWNIGSSVMKTLAEAGHEVTVVSPFVLKPPMPNYRDIEITELKNADINIFDTEEWSAHRMVTFLSGMGTHIVNYTLNHENFKKLLKSDETFDAVIVELFVSEPLLGIGQHFNCPVIGLSTFGTSKWTNDLTRNPSPTSYVPHNFLEYMDRMTFTQRLWNTLLSHYEGIFYELVHYPVQEALYEQHFGHTGTTLEMAMKNVSLVLVYNHFSVSTIRPFLTNMVEIGGVHVGDPKPLPAELQEFLDSAHHGVIYFSMGSIIQAVDWPEEKREAFIKAFGKLKMKVLWKYENDTLPDSPSNVKIGKWLPQRDILAHPNVRVFITHGGLLGTTEAITEGVPVLGIPIYADQRMNMNMAMIKEFGLMLDYHNITEASVSYYLNEILNNPKYQMNAKQFSNLYLDRITSAKKTTLYWVEYVIRHGGASHLKAAAIDLTFIKYHLIDVYCTIGLATLLLVYFVYRSFRFIMMSFLSGKRKEKYS